MSGSIRRTATTTTASRHRILRDRLRRHKLDGVFLQRVHTAIANAIVSLGLDGITPAEFDRFAQNQGWDKKKNVWNNNPYSDLLNAWIQKHCLGNAGDWDFLLKRGQFAPR